ncbi:MAG: hypothetical protein K8H88_29105, partial [Sandaracinaceae bacterium]|nr:hypothetical protein [Sandaracinaceae bacterium]
AAVVGCGGSTPGADAAACSAVNATVGSNHGHVLAVPPGHVSAGAMQTYDTTGGDHSHQVTVSAAEFEALQMGMTVTTRTTTVGSHDHSITLRCA